MLVKPADGRLVRCPVRGTVLPESGEDVPENIFWTRRLRDGDVVRVKDSQKPVTVAPAAAPASDSSKNAGEQ
ncbi:DUF2635 domain-containing protein [Pantoea ananatis]|uniref:DUF2635 domain-containing protein n=1 Tax=Pantoea ananas TaxID=553 RepID=UPI001B31747C|nr:DUF2635 domain-containing protein [Pantoea ananatis]